MDGLVGPAAEDLRALRLRRDGFWLHVSLCAFQFPISPSSFRLFSHPVTAQ